MLAACLSEVGAEQTVAATGAELADSFLTNLADTFARQAEGLAYLLQRHLRLVVDAEAAFDNLLLAFVEDA